MLATLLTGLFLAVQALDQLGRRLSREEPPPYLVHQPLPWQLHSVSRSRRGSRDSGKAGSSRRSSLRGTHAPPSRRAEAAQGAAGSESAEAAEAAEAGDPEKAAMTIQHHFRKHRRHKLQE